jgi:single-strand DNA-binding protein
MNVFTFSGNLGKDCEVRYTTGGDPIANFNVAVRSGYGKSEATSWINCTYWGKRGEAVAPYLKKGSMVIVTGEFTMQKWTDKQGQERESPTVNVRDLTLGSRPNQESASAESQPQSNEQSACGSSFDHLSDDMPF